MTQAGLEEPQICLALYRAHIFVLLCTIYIYNFYCILFDENSSNIPTLMRTPVGTRC